MSWGETFKPVTRSYVVWYLVHQDIVAFLKVGLRFARKGYEDTWEEVRRRPATDDDPDWPEPFEREVDNLWPGEFDWMFLAAVVRDAVTAFEVYLENVVDEVLKFHNLARVNDDKAPLWPAQTAFFEKYFAFKLDEPRIMGIRRLRHLLTHRRGELRTEEQRMEFGTRENEWGPAFQAVLTEDNIKVMLEGLAEVVRRIDAIAYRYSWCGERIPHLTANK